jgi:hypothetical protein
MKIIGIDPGASYVGVVIREEDTLLWSATFVRPKDMTDPLEWSTYVSHRVQKEVIDLNPEAKIGLESVTTPNSHHQGRLALINPKSTINLAMVAGAINALNPEATRVRPGKNGSQPVETYPTELCGRRPKTLPGFVEGAKTRNHEKSAWDVAGETQLKLSKVKNTVVKNPNPAKPNVVLPDDVDNKPKKKNPALP